MNALIPQDQVSQLPSVAEDVKLFESAKFFKRIQLYGTKAGAVTEEKIAAGHYGIPGQGGETIKDIGKEVDCIPLSMRYKAMDVSSSDDVITVYDHTSSEFTRIKDATGVQDSGCMAGIEFLIWYPEEHNYFTFFLQSKSSLKVAPDIKGFMAAGQAITLRVRVASNKKFKWQVPEVVACSTPLEIPDFEEAKAQCEKFVNPESEEIVKEDSRER